MPSDDLERIRASFERWNTGDREFEDLHPELEMSTPLASTRGEPYRGPEGFRRWIADIDEQFDRWELRPSEFRELEDGRVFALGTIMLRGRGSHVEMEQPMAWLFETRDGMLYRYTVWTSHEEALRAVGEA